MSPCPHLTGGGNKMKSVLRVVATLSLVLAASHAAAQTDYPNRQIRIIVGFTAGTAPDVAARILATKFAETWNVPVTVEDITGAGSNIATDRVAKAAPDGYTLLMGGNPSLVINPSLYVKLPFDPVKDFAPISQVFVAANLLVVHPDVPAKTLPELVALAKAQPGKLTYGHAGDRHVAASRRRIVQIHGRMSTSRRWPIAARPPCCRTCSPAA